jgi:hypothetical protein
MPYKLGRPKRYIIVTCNWCKEAIGYEQQELNVELTFRDSKGIRYKMNCDCPCCDKRFNVVINDHQWMNAERFAAARQILEDDEPLQVKSVISNYDADIDTIINITTTEEEINFTSYPLNDRSTREVNPSHRRPLMKLGNDHNVPFYVYIIGHEYGPYVEFDVERLLRGNKNSKDAHEIIKFNSGDAEINKLIACDEAYKYKVVSTLRCGISIKVDRKECSDRGISSLIFNATYVYIE